MQALPQYPELDKYSTAIYEKKKKERRKEGKREGREEA